MKIAMDVNSIRTLLRRACEEAGSQTKWAEMHGISVQLVNLFLQGTREPGPTLLRALGFEKVESVSVDYQPMEKRR